MNSLNTMLALDREEMSELERELFLKDLKRVTDEYFECGLAPSLEVTRSDEGFLVCIILSARRIKSIKKPQ